MNDEEKKEVTAVDRQCSSCKEFKRYYIIRNDSLHLTFFGRCYNKKTKDTRKHVDDVCPDWCFGSQEELMPIYGNVLKEALEMLSKTDDEMTRFIAIFPDYETLDYRILKRRAKNHTKICPTCRYFTQYYIKNSFMMWKTECGKCNKKNTSVKRLYNDCELWEERNLAESTSETVRSIRNRAHSLYRAMRRINLVLKFLESKAQTGDYEYEPTPYRLNRNELPETKSTKAIKLMEKSK